MSTLDKRAAAPAIIAIVGCLALTLAVVLGPAAPDVGLLRERVARARTAGDETAALLLLQKSTALAPDVPGDRFDLAMALARTGRRDEAVAVLRTLAPIDAAGFPPAHLQLAEWAAEASVMGGGLDPAALREAREHARRAAADPAFAARAADVLRLFDGL